MSAAKESVGRTGSRTSEAYARLREDIISGTLKPGAKLKIDELSKGYALGATPMREALSYLAADGLVMREDQRGFRVADVSAPEFEELLHVRCLIEERALRLSIARGDGEWEDAVAAARYQLAKRDRPVGYDGDWERAHRRFHLALLSACGSSILLRLCGQLFDENNRYRHLSRFEGSAQRSVRDEHEAIAEAVLARDADLAVERLIGHYRRTGELLRRALREIAGEDGA